MTQHTELIKEYRPTMHADVLHLWAKEARDALEAQAREIAELKAQESELCTLHGLAEAECKRLRKNAERYQWLRDQANSVQHTAPLVFNAPGDGSRLQWTSALHGQALDDVLDAAIAMKGQP